MRHFSMLPSTLLALLTTVTSTNAASLPEELSQGVQIDHTTKIECTAPSKAGDVIAVDYSGTLEDGTEFDTSYGRGPFTFKLGAGRVIKGWDIALLDMCPGEARKLTVPPELAYGSEPMGKIPADSTLIFDTVLVSVNGLKQDPVSISTSAPSPSPTVQLAQEIEDAVADPTTSATQVQESAKPQETGSDAGPMAEAEKPKKRCQLLGPFALLVQGALGGFAILTLVFKRYREKPQRPWKIWFFDVSKQIFGSMLTHVLNVGMSMLSSVELANHAENVANQAAEGGHRPNPCSFYLLNLAIDTTLGIPVLYVLLMVITALCLRTPLARPPQSIKSGSYGDPPKTTWYLKQLLIYFIGLTGMKFAVFLLFSLLPWLPWVGDWALRWTQFDERVEIAFAMFIFPLIMNAVQYYVIDNLIMDRKKDKVGYQAVMDDEGRDEEDRLVGEETLYDGDDDRFKLDDEDEDESLKDVDPVASSYGSSAQSTLRNDKDSAKSK
ncbi:hypothetical protein AMS68_005316 [Peltaster fructicola]|uniref:peptidylprolyl isomerase n=1 Tax=Peltaster fructicola TaxID=286661 RepID=A0A6H0XYV7_9PEZI|nr:hypothetical protein AMS68_005316 [Peltaster fructicola]